MYLNHHDDILQLSKDKDNFYIIARSKNFQSAQKKSYIWDVVFRDAEAKEFLTHLKDMKDLISNSAQNNDKNVKSNNNNLPPTFVGDIESFSV